MFNFFRKKQPKKKSSKPIYMVAYACRDHHCQAVENDGICLDCGEAVSRAVCEGATLQLTGCRIPYGDGFVRWLNPELHPDTGTVPDSGTETTGDTGQ